jgi:hypothetical protein
VLVLGLIAAASGCATLAPLAVVPPNAVGSPVAQSGSGQGDLIVYSATFAPTLEEGEYPVHTDYSIATTSDRLLEHVANRTGSFDKHPATISLESGEYHVRAQYARGGFVRIPVVIKPGKTTTVDLDGAAKPQGISTALEPIRLPNGDVIGWRAISAEASASPRPRN